MIPHIIHYCWFGNSPLPNTALKCISSWEKYLPNYIIQQWNESNFDVNMTQYTAEAYKHKKYAFVSDYARFWILYHYGGLYFDTDVQIVNSLDSIIEHGAFMGREAGTKGKVAPGLGLGVQPYHKLYWELLNEYSLLHFVNSDGTLNQKTIVDYTTDVLIRRGLLLEDILQEIEDITIYPSEYMCPMDSTNGIIRMTPNTVTIHHYDCSWLDHKSLRWQLHILKNSVNRLLYFFRLKR